MDWVFTTWALLSFQRKFWSTECCVYMANECREEALDPYREKEWGIALSTICKFLNLKTNWNVIHYPIQECKVKCVWETPFSICTQLESQIDHFLLRLLGISVALKKQITFSRTYGNWEKIIKRKKPRKLGLGQTLISFLKN